MRRLFIRDLPPLRHAARAGRRTRYWLTAFVLLAVLLAACSSKPVQPLAEPIGYAYSGPAAVNLRKDLGNKAATVGTVQHGERLAVLETRRRFVKVRTAKGLEGWTDASSLLTQQQVDDLDKLAAAVANRPSQGSATVYDALNIHTAPARQAPSFAQIPEKGTVDVIAHQVAERVTAPPVSTKPAAKKSASKVAQKKKAPAEPVLPPPPPPPVPENLIELSRPRVSDLQVEEALPVARPATDDWYLVRTHDGKAGWVLARQLLMSIPDEVAQYAEGHTITGYASLGEFVDKDDGTKHSNWLWTTSAPGQHPYDFDGFRVFVWSIKRHRYETAYIERNVTGFYPIETHDAADQDVKSFSVVLEDKDGQRYKRTYAFNGYRVQLVSKVPCEPPPALPEVRAVNSFDVTPGPVEEKRSWSDRFGDLKKRWFKR